MYFIVETVYYDKIFIVKADSEIKAVRKVRSALLRQTREQWEFSDFDVKEISEYMEGNEVFPLRERRVQKC